MKLPRKLQIGSYVVNVSHVSAPRLREITGSGLEAWAAWDVDKLTIYISKAARGKRKNLAFYHELMHCLVDLLDKP